MNKARYVLRIIVGVLAGIMLVGIAFNNLWNGFSYFIYISLLSLLPVVFVLLLLRYKTTKQSIEDSFSDFLNEEYNKGNITKEEKEQPSNFLRDEYMKVNKKELGIIIIVMVLIFAIFLSTITYGLNSL